jgi:hypothetical protein
MMTFLSYFAPPPPSTHVQFALTDDQPVWEERERARISEKLKNRVPTGLPICTAPTVTEQTATSNNMPEAPDEVFKMWKGLRADKRMAGWLIRP